MNIEACTTEEQDYLIDRLVEYNLSQVEAEQKVYQSPKKPVKSTKKDLAFRPDLLKIVMHPQGLEQD